MCVCVCVFIYKLPFGSIFDFIKIKEEIKIPKGV